MAKSSVRPQLGRRATGGARVPGDARLEQSPLAGSQQQGAKRRSLARCNDFGNDHLVSSSPFLVSRCSDHWSPRVASTKFWALALTRGPLLSEGSPGVGDQGEELLCGRGAADRDRSDHTFGGRASLLDQRVTEEWS